MDTKRFKPLRLDVKAELARAMQQPGFKAAWEALEEEYSAINTRLRATKPPQRRRLGCRRLATQHQPDGASR